MFRFVLLGLLMVSTMASARPLTKEQKLEDFRTLVSVINAAYGPLEYKMSNKIVDITLLNSQVEQQVVNTATNRDFYYTLVKYVAAYRDGHFGISVPSTAMATVPVTTDLVGGKVLITKIDRSKLREAKFNFSAGDEIISVDGQPIQAWLDETSTYIGDGNVNSQRRKTAWTVFFRRASRLPMPTAKTVKVEIRRGTSANIESAELEWTIAGTSLDELVVTPTPNFTPFGLRSSFTEAGSNFDQLENLSRLDYLHPLADRDYACSGTTRVTIPADATVIMKEPFVAYYHPTAKGNIGYLRIPHYSPPSKPGENRTEVAFAWVAQYEFAVRELEKNTVGLIIDQDHNCGGSVWIVHKMLSFFMDKKFQVSPFEMLATKESYLAVEAWVNQAPKFTVDFENLTRVLNLVKNTWLTGTSRLTAKTAIDGQEIFEANLIHYTKPVVVLIDEMAGSGGDMFPAMMKGLGRAKLFGQTTAGLGGHINMYPAPLPNSQMKFSLTKSLFYRPDGVAIENNGAVADERYVITRDDVLYGFKDYQKAYLAYLTQMLP
jgi:C-terminal processing protease CtpA/Prc